MQFVDLLVIEPFLYFQGDVLGLVEASVAVRLEEHLELDGAHAVCVEREGDLEVFGLVRELNKSVTIS